MSSASQNTSYLKKQPHQYFYADAKDRVRQVSSIDINQLEIIPTCIHTEDIWPNFSDKFSLPPEPRPEKYYIKEANLLHYSLST